MKKALALIISFVMLISCMPITASASASSMLNNYFYGGIAKPQAPILHHFNNDIWDCVDLWQDENSDIINFGTAVNGRSWDEFLDNNGLMYLDAYIQVDTRIDGGNWNYSADWENGDYSSICENWGTFYVPQASISPEWMATKTQHFSILEAVYYSFDAPNSNGIFKNMIYRTGTNDENYRYYLDTENHTFGVRYRYKIVATDDHETQTLFSEWSDETSIGKNGTQALLTKSATPAAITITSGSCLGDPNAEHPRNEFYLDIDVPQSIYNDLKYYEIVENAFEPILIEVQYRVNGGNWINSGVANATSIDSGERLFNGTDKPLKKGDKVEFRMRVAEGDEKNIKGNWSNIYTSYAVVTDYNYVEEVVQEKPITSLEDSATEKQVTDFITGLKSDADPKGTSFRKFPVQQSSVTNTSVKIKWNKVKGAAYYIVYGNKCGTKNRYKKIKKVTALNFTQKGLKKGTYYKYLVSAFDKNGKHIATSLTTHIVTNGGKYCNFKSVSTKAKKNAVTLKKKGKTFKLGAKAVKANSKKKANVHRKLKYESSNKKIATVDASGKITAKKKGTCYIWVYAQNGAYAKVKVTVKK